MTDSQVETGAGATTRRAVLAGAGALGATTLLAACGTDDGDSLAGGDNSSTGSAPAGAATTGAATGGATSGGAPSGGGTKLAATSDISVGGGKIFKEQQVVVTQPAKGTFKGFSAICTHQGCTVANVENGTINCGCHNSRFSIEDGSVQQGPATKALDSVSIKVDGTEITLG